MAAIVAACGEAEPRVNLGPVPPRIAIASGGAAEVNLDVPAASRVTAAFTAAAPLAWNVHVHHGDDVEIQQAGTDASATIEVAPATGGVYSLLWENAGRADLELGLTLGLDGGASVISWSTR